MRRSKADKAITHSKILAVAAKRFRERGLEGIAVADVMKEAGSSVGGFYKHFGSRDELVVEALAEAFKDLDRWEEEAADLPAFLEQFLSDGNNTRPAIGCAVTAFAGDVRHASTSVRTVYTQRVKHTISYYNNGVKGGDPQSRRTRAILLLSAAVGSVSLARAVNDRALSQEILKAVRDEFAILAQRPLPRVVKPKD
ncbi:MAG: TetR/AcrR family transcriptional regulator [Edaphobacter sp.]|uniref:TetR/AcrR family transcriptional regulator n=1 Tax=Edaphobacter sp. TaxID=1934404 RepID=UPI00239A52D2|nr:TetR/AcrR family transcriptional regulator [Edaphobacter sp.]MDE1176360.1 TetR/AcrR family transcriptional regulator [Edaphobacter sp.]